MFPISVNGFPVIDGHGSTDRRECVVVCDRGTCFHDRYVTWRVFTRDDGQHVVTGGYYTPDYGKAVRNMLER